MARILLVDDEPSILAALARALRRDGHEVLTAPDGRQALDLAAQETPDLVITDIRMPVMDGLELLRHLGQRRPRIPAIVMSAYATTEAAVGAMRLGACDFLAKPFKLPQLREAIERALATHATSNRLHGRDRTPHDFIAAPGASEWFYDIWHAAPGRRAILMARLAPSAHEALAAFLRAEATHHHTPSPVVARMDKWLGEPVPAFLAFVDILDRVMRHTVRGLRACLHGASFGATTLAEPGDEAGVAVEASDRLVVADPRLFDHSQPDQLLAARSIPTGALLRLAMGDIVRVLEDQRIPLGPDASARDYMPATEALAERAGLDDDETFRLVVALHEAVDNALRHGGRDGRAPSVQVRLVLTPTELIVEVRDDGCGFDTTVAEPALVGTEDRTRGSGRGFLLMHRLADRVEVVSAVGRGTTVRLEKGRSCGNCSC